MSFLSRLFGSKPPLVPGEDPSAAPTTGQLDHQGFVVRATPFKANGQYQTAGVIEKEIGGVLKSQRFVRADRTTSVEEATQLALAKGRLMIDEQGESLFS